VPYHEPDPEDPLQLHGVGVPDPSGDGLRQMAECFAEEFLRLGHSPARVLELFRSRSYALPHRAWRELGEDAVRALIDDAARVWSRAHRMPTLP
jgi:hypothetical protein